MDSDIGRISRSLNNSLTGDNIDEIIADAFAAPVGNIKND